MSPSELKLSHPEVIPARDRMAAPLRLAFWIRFETVVNQQDWLTAIELLAPQIHLPDTCSIAVHMASTAPHANWKRSLP